MTITKTKTKFNIRGDLKVFDNIIFASIFKEHNNLMLISLIAKYRNITLNWGYHLGEIKI